MTPEDAAALRMLAGASFAGPVTLPSGATLTADEAQAFTAAYVQEDDPQDFIRRSEAARREGFLRHCQPATPADYAAWLVGWLARGGAVTHEYGYPMPSGFVVLVESVRGVMPSMYGADKLQVIVPEGVHLVAPDTFHGGCGHSTVYSMEGFEVIGSWVPVYPDVIESLNA